MSAERPHQTEVMIVDDHPFVRYGLKQLINAAKGLRVCAEADCYRKAVEELQRQTPDVVIVDISLKDISGIELIKEIREKYPSMPVIVLSMHEEATFGERAISAGAKGYVMKQDGTESIIKAIETVLSGRIYMSHDMMSRMIEKGMGQPGKPADISSMLSNRELEVFSLVGRGNSTMQIADALCLSVKTVETHRSNIKKKLAISGNTDLIRHAALWVESQGKAF